MKFIGKTTKNRIINFVKKISLAYQEFNFDKCHQLSSTLTVYSIMSVIPILAMIFGVAKGFGFEKKLQEQIINQLPQTEELSSRLINFATNLLDETQGSLITSVGIIILFWSASRLFWHLEHIFDKIWHIKSKRTIGTKFINYFFILFLFPSFILLSNSVMFMISSYLVKLRLQLPFFQNIGFFAKLPFMIIPYVIIWLIFTVLFIFLPNRRISIRSAAIAGIFSGTLFQIVQFLYLKLQLNLSIYNPIYGSFAAIPLLIAWLIFSWSIILFGAELAFVNQFYNPCLKWTNRKNLNFYQKKCLSLKILCLIGNQFTKGGRILTSKDIANTLKLQEITVIDLLNNLVEISLVAKASGRNSGYIPAMGIELFTVGNIVKMLENSNSIKDDQEKSIDNFELQLKDISVDKLVTELKL